MCILQHQDTCWCHNGSKRQQIRPTKSGQWYIYLDQMNDDKTGKHDHPGQAFKVGLKHARFVSESDTGFEEQSLAGQL